MNKSWAVLVFLIIFSAESHAALLNWQTHVDASTREIISLNGTWKFQFDHQRVGQKEQWQLPSHDVSSWREIQVPGSWDLQFKELFNRQGVAWYRLSFDAMSVFSQPMKRMVFEGIFREADVWLNGQHIGHTNRPYLASHFDVSKLLKEKDNVLVLRIDNRIHYRSIPANTFFYHRNKLGWMPYGGITRDVRLEAGAVIWPERVFINGHPDGNFQVKLKLGGLEGGGRTQLKGWISYHGKSVLELERVDASKEINLAGRLEKPKLWTPQSPEYYVLHLEIQDSHGSERSDYKFSFKAFAANQGQLQLNGTPIYLRGINRHEEHPDWGPVYRPEVAKQDVDLIKELEVNFIRPGHYPVHPSLLQDLEAAGLMIVEELPIYQLEFHHLRDIKMLGLALNLLEGMIVRDYNRPGIVMWSVANEIHNWHASAGSFVRSLYQRAKQLDPHRPVMVASLTLPPWLQWGPLRDRSSGEVDVIGINEYFGWYTGDIRDTETMLRRYFNWFPNKTFFVSEFGADAIAGKFEGTAGPEDNNNHSFSEEFQEWFINEHLKIYQRLPFIQGTMPWIFSDFRYQWTLNTGKNQIPLMNLKGLVDSQRQKKKSFYTVQKHYRTMQTHRPK
jgi:beta-glucuronidase